MSDNTGNLQIREESFAVGTEEFTIQWLQMGEDTFMTTQQAADALGVTPDNIRCHLREHNMHTSPAPVVMLAELKAKGVIPLRTSTNIHLLPVGTIDALVKLVKTEAAWAAYRTVLKAARAGQAEMADRRAAEGLTKILALGEGQGLPVKTLARMLGTTEANIRGHLHDHGLPTIKATLFELSEMKAQGVLPIRTHHANLLPKKTIQDLVKLVDTPEAMAIWQQVGKVPTSLIEKLTEERDRLQVERSELRAATLDNMLTGPQLVQLKAAIKARSKLFESPTTSGAIARDIKFRFFGVDLMDGMRIDHLAQKDLLAAMALVQTWNRQLSPLTRVQARALEQWIRNTAREAPYRDADLKTALDLNVVEEVEA